MTSTLRSHKALDIAVLILWPIVLTAANDTWIFVKPIFIDRWIYSGFHMHLQALLKTYAYTYYAARAPWDLLGWVAHRVLPTEWALYALHIFVFYVSAFSIYYAVSRLFDDRVAALTAALLLATQSEFLTATGWDYVDGAYTACIALSLAGIAATGTPRGWHWGALIWGVGATLTVSLYLLMIVLIPVELLLFVLLNRQNRRPLLQTAAWWLCGVAVTLIVVGTGNALAGGPFLYFMGQILMMSAVAARRPFNFIPPSQWIGQATWLLTPVAALLFSLFATFRETIWALRARSIAPPEVNWPLFSTAVSYCVAFGIFVLLETDHFIVLQADDKVNALLPFVFLPIGGAVAVASRRCSASYRAALATGVGLLTILPWILSSRGTIMPFGNAFAGLTAEIVWAVAGAVALTILVLWPPRPFVLVPYFTVVAAFIGIGFGAADTDTMQFPVNPTYKEATLAVFEAMQEVAPFNPEARARFWFDNHDKAQRLERDVVSSYLYGLSLINEHFPDTTSWTGEPAKFGPGDRVIFLTSGTNPIAIANKAVKGSGIVFREVAHRRIERPGVDFDFVVADAHADSSAISDLRQKGRTAVVK